MREVALDTETTGLDPHSGHRLVEIACMEIINHVPTGETFHTYINPKRDMPEPAFAVHGLSTDFLKNHPLFEEKADEFLEFIGDSKLIIHNAQFDLKFLNAELGWLDKPQIDPARAIDTLKIARQKFPGAKNNLDALCRRFNINNANRTLHGALIDTQLLVEVYIELIGGKQRELSLNDEKEKIQTASEQKSPSQVKIDRPHRSFSASEKEIKDHEKLIDKIKNPLWRAS